MSELKRIEEVKGTHPVYQAVQGAEDETPLSTPRASAAHAFRSDF